VDFGILVDGAVVMVENIFRQMAACAGKPFQLKREVIGRRRGSGPPDFLRRGRDRGGLPAHLCAVRAVGQTVQAHGGHHDFRLIGSLVVTLILLPVLCSWFLRKGVRERRNPVFEAIKSALHQGPGCLSGPSVADHAASVVVLAGSLLLIPAVGAEFMPQLDEGALWVRATMPYTISFEESAKISPQIRKILRSFPEVTTVASEHGRPDDGTDSTGFFNVEFYVGLKPYSEWKGAVSDQGPLIEAINEKLQAFPGIIFNYTQPAEDAVDEAETGLKSSLAVKIFGPTCNTLENKGKAIKKSWNKCAASKM
jgi:cobalt-zinc-cadmium resistance protein CzcA